MKSGLGGGQHGNRRFRLHVWKNTDNLLELNQQPPLKRSWSEPREELGLAPQSRAAAFLRLLVSILHQSRKHLKRDRHRHSGAPLKPRPILTPQGQSKADLRPAAIPADHVRVGHGAEERVRLQVVWQATEELRDVDEVHLQQDLLVQTQDPQPRPKQALLAVPAKDVPHPTRHVQWERLTVQGEDPKIDRHPALLRI